MSLIATTESNAVENILAGEDLWVVLENRFGLKDYVESYKLTSILGRGDLFYARFRHIHSCGVHVANSDGALRGRCGISYGYNNFANVVSTSSIEDNFIRLYSARAYSRIHFFTKTPFEEVWSSDNADQGCEGVYNAVVGARELKLKVELKDGVYFMLPLHTVEAYKDKSGFRGDTEIDGFALTMHNFDWLAGLGADMDINDKENQHREVFYSTTTYTVEAQFAGLLFEVTKAKLQEAPMQACMKMRLEQEVIRYSILARSE